MADSYEDGEKSTSDWGSYSQHSRSTTFTVQRDNELRVDVTEAANDVYFEDQILWGDDPNKSYFAYMMETEKEWTKTRRKNADISAGSIRDDTIGDSTMEAPSTMSATFNTSTDVLSNNKIGKKDGLQLEHGHVEFSPSKTPKNGTILVVSPKPVPQSSPATVTKDIPSVIYFGEKAQHTSRMCIGVKSDDTITSGQRSLLFLRNNRRLLMAFFLLLFFAIVLGTTFIVLSLAKRNGSPDRSTLGDNSLESQPILQNTSSPVNSSSYVPTVVPSGVHFSTPSPAEQQPSIAPFREANAPQRTSTPSFFAPNTIELSNLPTQTPSFVSTAKHSNNLNPSSIRTNMPNFWHTVQPTLIDPNLDTLSPSLFPVTTSSPTIQPTQNPTVTPSQRPTNVPTATSSPVSNTTNPTIPSTTLPTTDAPVIPITQVPTMGPTFAQTVPATLSPVMPMVAPVVPATQYPTLSPTLAPVVPATPDPTLSPTLAPVVPATPDPTLSPTLAPVVPATPDPTVGPTFSPVIPATLDPSLQPTAPPTLLPTLGTTSPTMSPTELPTPPLTLSPTDAPTNQPIILVTASPTLMPTTLVPTAVPVTDTVETWIQVDKRSYTIGEDIVILFKNVPPVSTDWIAMEDVTNGKSSRWDSVLWILTCGTQDCQEATSEGTIVFGPGDPYEGEFDQVQPGSYVMHLLRGEGDYQSYAWSDTFTIVDASPAPGPVGSPVGR